MNLNNVLRYPNFNSPRYTEHPVLARTPLSQLMGVAIPLIVLAFAALAR
jgi:hypothetical protein